MTTARKSDIAQRVGLVAKHFEERTELDWFDIAKDALNLILEQMSETLANGKRVEIRGFGSFKLQQYGNAVHYTRHPKTGEVSYKARSPRVAFKAGKEFKACLNVEK